MTTYSDLIEKTERYLVPATQEEAVPLAGAVTAGAMQLPVSQANPNYAAIRPGCIVSADLELFYVQGVQGTTIDVVPGYLGSTPADHGAGTLLYIDPRFSRYDISVALNDAITDMSSPLNGLYQIVDTDITYVPVFMGYDLGGLPTNFIDVLNIQFKEAPPWMRFPQIRKWRVLRNQTDPRFPSGNGIVIYQGAWPGLPIHVIAAAPFVPLVNLTDDVVAVSGLSSSMADIPPLGAAYRLVEPREVKRNATEQQPDPRKFQEVPPGAIMNSSGGLRKQWQERIDAEADRLRRQNENYNLKDW